MKNRIAAKILGITIISFMLFQGCSEKPLINLEKVTQTVSWTSPTWGYNAPKIVNTKDNTVFVISMTGSYPEGEAQIFQRINTDKWTGGKVFNNVYQPSMIILDNEQHLNVIDNSQNNPVRHHRSLSKEIKEFDMIAEGNGLPDGRGWYIGVGVYEQKIYMSYISNDYKLWFTWKNINDNSWQDAVLIFEGYASPDGNRSLLYPKFQFYDDKGYFMTSHTDDGSTYNTYNSIYLTTFPLDNPGDFTNEIVFQGHTGYYSYGYDMIIDDYGSIYCAHSAGKHSYGDIVPEEVSEGLYVSVKNKNDDAWCLYQVEDRSGCIALHSEPSGVLYAVVTAGSWFEENHTSLKKSKDQGKTWETVIDNLFADYPDIKHQFFMQSVQSHSGSKINDIQIVFSDSNYEKDENGLYSFDLYYLEIDLP